jgi:hypothetical protein
VRVGEGGLSGQRFIVRTWTKGEQDFQEEAFVAEAAANDYAEGSRIHGYEATVEERQPDLFGAPA